MMRELVETQLSHAQAEVQPIGDSRERTESVGGAVIRTPSSLPKAQDNTEPELDPIEELDASEEGRGEEEPDIAMSCAEWVLLQRYKTQEFVEHDYFEWSIIVLIGASSVVLAIDNPGIKEGSDTFNHLYTINLVFVVIFAMEMVLKMFAYGIKGYLSDSWNILDFTVVVSSLLSLAIPEAQLLRALRVLRPLRIMSVNEGMRVIVDAISKSGTAIFNVLVVCMLFWLIFAIMGVSFFSGRYRTCSCSNGTVLPEGAQLDCTQLGCNMDVFSQNFDNTIHGLLTVFEISALEIWPDIMFAGIDSSEQNHAPVRDNQRFMGAWFMLLVFCSSLFLVNLFVGVVVDNFKRTSEEADGTMYLTLTISPNPNSNRGRWHRVSDAIAAPLAVHPEGRVPGGPPVRDEAPLAPLEGHHLPHRAAWHLQQLHLHDDHLQCGLHGLYSLQASGRGGVVLSLDPKGAGPTGWMHPVLAHGTTKTPNPNLN